MEPPAFEEFQELYVRPKAGRTLVLGSQVYEGREDRRLRYEDALGVDMLRGPGVDRVLNFEHSLPDNFGTFAHVECLSVLEHSRRPWLLAANIERVLNKGGTLFIAVPFIWRCHAYPNDYFRYTTEGIRILFPGITFAQVMYAGKELALEWATGQALHDNDYPYLPRTEVYAFGAKLW